MNRELFDSTPARKRSREDILRAVREAAEPAAASFGLEVWGIELAGAGRPVVRIYVDAPVSMREPVAPFLSAGDDAPGVQGGAGVEQCAEISRMVGLALEVDEVFADAWVLEVSSPGMDRLFFQASQLAPYAGSEIDVTLTDPHPDIAGRRKFRGPLVNVSGDTFTMEVLLAPAAGEKPAPSNVSIRWDWVRKARLVPVFPDTSKPGAGKNAKKAAGKGGGKQA